MTEITTSVLTEPDNGPPGVEIFQFLAGKMPVIGVAIDRQKENSTRPQYPAKLVTPCLLCLDVQVSEDRKRIDQIETLVGIVEHGDHRILADARERDAALTCLDEILIYVGSTDIAYPRTVPIPDDPPTPAAKIKDIVEASDWRPISFQASRGCNQIPAVPNSRKPGMSAEPATNKRAQYPGIGSVSLLPPSQKRKL